MICFLCTVSPVVGLRHPKVMKHSIRSVVAIVAALSCFGLLLPATPARASQIVSLDGTAGGKKFDGIGAVSGGSGTSVLLKDYPEPQRSQVLDLLFKPKFGAAMSTLLVEVPGDGNGTQGTEPSHMHARDDLNYGRGYEWWIMSEAKKRNPDLTLDACAWSCPAWVGHGQFWSQDMADYYVKWIQGLKSAHGLELDAIGCRNEKGVDAAFAKKFRAALDAAGLQAVRIHGFDNWGAQKFDFVKEMTTDAELRNAIGIISNHTMTEIPASPAVQQQAAAMGKPLWNSEEHIYLKGFDCEIALVKSFNENFIESGMTKIVNWYLAGSVYPIEPYADDPPALIANSPWSGHYRPREVLWGYAHYGQFSAVGWTYLNGACGKLDGGGTFVTLKSPGKDYSVILETKNAKAAQSVTFRVSGGLATGPLGVWRSDAREQFAPQPALVPHDGAFTLTLEPNAIYSISTTTGQQKGAFADVPAERTFPFPYYETFDEYTVPKQTGYLPRYLADIGGVFEIVERPDKTGRCLRQVTAQRPQCWAPEWIPYTVLGDANWTDYEVSADVLLADGGWAGVMGHLVEVGNGYGTEPRGYYLKLSADGRCALVAINGKDGAEELGDKEHQERLRAEAAAGKTTDRGEKQMGGGALAHFSPQQWHNVKLRFAGHTITGFVDGVQVVATTNTLFGHGMAGLVTGEDHGIRTTAYFDNLLIGPVGGAKPSPTGPAPAPQPLY